MKVNIKYNSEGYAAEHKIKIHKCDVWDMSFTLAHIIHPMLIKLKKTKHGAPNVSNDDVPKKLHNDGSCECPEDQPDKNWFKRWDYVMDEMIWGFNEIKNRETDLTWETDYQERLDNALRLFGKYYRNLWD